MQVVLGVVFMLLSGFSSPTSPAQDKEGKVVSASFCTGDGTGEILNYLGIYR